MVKYIGLSLGTLLEDDGLSFVRGYVKIWPHHLVDNIDEGELDSVIHKGYKLIGTKVKKSKSIRDMLLLYFSYIGEVCDQDQNKLDDDQASMQDHMPSVEVGELGVLDDHSKSVEGKPNYGKQHQLIEQVLENVDKI